MNYSVCQKKIFETYNTTKQNILISAGPGSGKSFVLRKLAKDTPPYKRSIFLSFNKSIAEENKTHLPNHITSSTLHALGYRCLFDLVPGARFQLNEIKTFIISRKNLKFPENRFRNEKVKNKYLFELARVYDCYRLNLQSNLDNFEELCSRFDIDLSENMKEDFDKLLKVMREDDQKILNGESNMIDFTDMLWLTSYFDSSAFPKYDVVFIDEVQDLNPLQKSLFEKIQRERTGRFVAVGDRKQTIYAFSNASLEFFNSLSRLPNTVELPLDISYRCGHNIIEASNIIFPDTPMKAFEENIEGVVRTGTYDEIQNGDFVLCRNNKPLVEMFIQLLKKDKNVSIYGKDYGESLFRLIEECEDKLDSITRENLYNKLLKTKEILEERGIKNPTSQPDYFNLLEKILILEDLQKEFLSYSRVREVISKYFVGESNWDREKGITLMTIHKSKGLEADRVFCLQENLIPSPYCVSSDLLYAEKCLYYVMMTRAKKEVIYLGSPGIGTNERERL